MSLVIKLVRHGESMANIGAVEAEKCADHSIELTPLGVEQAKGAGRLLGTAFIEGALAFTSPYTRARMTLNGLLEGAGLSRAVVRVYEDPRMREVDPGYTSRKAQEEMRRKHGWFYYRFEGGESPADCFDRTSGFLDSMMRQVERKGAERVLIVTHGLTLRCFVMRFLHLTVEDFNVMSNPNNCDIVTLAPKETIEEPQFISGRWGVTGLRLKDVTPVG